MSRAADRVTDRAEHPVDGDHEHHPLGVLPRPPVTSFVPVLGVRDGRPIGADGDRAFQAQPAPPVHLTHHGAAAAIGVPGFRRPTARDHPDDARGAVPGEPDGHDVRAAVGAQRGQRRQVSFGEEREDGVRQRAGDQGAARGADAACG
jgi:hypothetical protein